MTFGWRLPMTVVLLLWYPPLQNTAAAVTFVPGISGGIMQQPTSNYYLACYGLSVDMATKDDGFIARGSYVERPVFSRDGYSEQDHAGLALIGGTALKIYGGTIRGFIGAGQVSGYVARTESENKTEIERRSYDMTGPAASFEYALKMKRAVFTLNHTTLVGFAGQDQTAALVAWPYNFYTLSFGIAI